MTITNNELKELLYKIALKFSSDEEARYFSEEIFEAYVRKYPRSNVLKDEVVSDTERQIKYQGNEMTIENDLPALLKLNFNHLPITFKLKWIHDQLIERANKNGIAIVSVYNSGGMHSLHTWAQGLAKRGYFVFGSYNGGPDGVVPLNGTRGIFGTNPITYGFPTNDGDVVIDMATSEIPYFEINNAVKNNLVLRENTAVNQEGLPTTDPKEAFDNGVSNLLPMGGNYKGYALNYLFEVMTGAMIGAKLSNKQDPDYVNEDHGGFLIVIDINAFSNTATFKSEVSELNKVVRAQKPAKGSQGVIIPGDKNLQRLQEAANTGEVEIAAEILEKIKNLAQ